MKNSVCAAAYIVIVIFRYNFIIVLDTEPETIEIETDFHELKNDTECIYEEVSKYDPG